MGVTVGVVIGPDHHPAGDPEDLGGDGPGNIYRREIAVGIPQEAMIVSIAPGEVIPHDLAGADAVGEGIGGPCHVNGCVCTAGIPEETADGAGDPVLVYPGDLACADPV